MKKETINEIEVLTIGQKSDKVIIFIHGRGADAQNILSLARFFPEQQYFIAPNAKNNQWYPYSFLEPKEKNQPYLNESLELLQKITKPFQKEHIYFAGFTQGACLALEFIAKNPAKYGGVAALSGGLIGDSLKGYKGDLKGTNIFLGCDENDPFIPVSRVHETEEVLKNLNASVKKNIYSELGHSINQDEIVEIKKVLK